jgi:hypothetical protein
MFQKLTVILFLEDGALKIVILDKAHMIVTYAEHAASTEDA